MKYSESEIVDCGTRLSIHLGLPVPEIALFEEKVREILIERENYECAKARLVTQQETASLLLQHFQTLICNQALVSEADLEESWSELIPLMQTALFKNENA